MEQQEYKEEIQKQIDLEEWTSGGLVVIHITGRQSRLEVFLAWGDGGCTAEAGLLPCAINRLSITMPRAPIMEIQRRRHIS